MSQTPTEPASPRVLARARARGDLPFSGELVFGLALLGLVLAGGGLLAGFVSALRRFAVASFAGRLSPAQVWAALPGLLQPLGVLLGVLASAALVGLLVQRAPTLRGAPDASGSADEGRTRAGRGRALHGLMTGFKALVLGVSLLALGWDSLAGWRATYGLSASELLGLSGELLPAIVVRAAWVCLWLGAVELAVQYVTRLRRLRMTRQQLMDEQRELVGDPRFLSERRARSAQGADVPMRLSPQLVAADLAQLSAAALLITGSAHVVALEYTPARGVPRVWLRAQGPHALELLSRAYSLELPIVSDELLAAALSRVPLRAAVPTEHHARVAQLLVEHAAPAAREAS